MLHCRDISRTFDHLATGLLSIYGPTNLQNNTKQCQFVEALRHLSDDTCPVKTPGQYQSCLHKWKYKCM